MCVFDDVLVKCVVFDDVLIKCVVIDDVLVVLVSKLCLMTC